MTDQRHDTLQLQCVPVNLLGWIDAVDGDAGADRVKLIVRQLHGPCAVAHMAHARINSHLPDHMLKLAEPVKLVPGKCLVFLVCFREMGKCPFDRQTVQRGASGCFFSPIPGDGKSDSRHAGIYRKMNRNLLSGLSCRFVQLCSHGIFENSRPYIMVDDGFIVLRENKAEDQDRLPDTGLTKLHRFLHRCDRKAPQIVIPFRQLCNPDSPVSVRVGFNHRDHTRFFFYL